MEYLSTFEDVCIFGHQLYFYIEIIFLDYQNNKLFLEYQININEQMICLYSCTYSISQIWLETISPLRVSLLMTQKSAITSYLYAASDLISSAGRFFSVSTNSYDFASVSAWLVFHVFQS